MTVYPIKDSDCQIEDISGPWIELDLKAISHNIEQIYRFSQTKLMPVIKAYAFGHGAIEVACHLEKMKPGQEIVLYGQQGQEKIPLEEIAALSKRSEYHLLARLHPALPRFY